MREKCGDLGGAERARMTAAAELDEASDPVDVGLLGSEAIVPKADLFPDGAEERAGCRGRGRGMSHKLYMTTCRISRRDGQCNQGLGTSCMVNVTGLPRYGVKAADLINS